MDQKEFIVPWTDMLIQSGLVLDDGDYVELFARPEDPPVLLVGSNDVSVGGARYYTLKSSAEIETNNGTVSLIGYDANSGVLSYTSIPSEYLEIFGGEVWSSITAQSGSFIPMFQFVTEEEEGSVLRAEQISIQVQSTPPVSNEAIPILLNTFSISGGIDEIYESGGWLAGRDTAVIDVSGAEVATALGSTVELRQAGTAEIRFKARYDGEPYGVFSYGGLDSLTKQASISIQQMSVASMSTDWQEYKIVVHYTDNSFTPLFQLAGEGTESTDAGVVMIKQMSVTQLKTWNMPKPTHTPITPTKTSTPTLTPTATPTVTSTPTERVRATPTHEPRETNPRWLGFEDVESLTLFDGVYVEGYSAPGSMIRITDPSFAEITGDTTSDDLPALVSEPVSIDIDERPYVAIGLVTKLDREFVHLPGIGWQNSETGEFTWEFPYVDDRVVDIGDGWIGHILTYDLSRYESTTISKLYYVNKVTEEGPGIEMDYRAFLSVDDINGDQWSDHKHALEVHNTQDVYRIPSDTHLFNPEDLGLPSNVHNPAGHLRWPVYVTR